MKENIQTPHNIELEQAILGTLLNNNEYYDGISDLIQPKDFFEITHQKIYEKIVDKLERGQFIDYLSLVNHCEHMGIEAKYLKEISELTFLTNLRVYAQELMYLSKKRALINIGKELLSNNQEEVEKQINNLENKIFSLLDRNIGGKTVTFYDGALSALRNVENFINNNQKISGVATGFTDLNSLLGGFRNGELIILAGRPAMGKTAFSVNMGVSIALEKHSVLFVSLEMPYEQVCMRIVSSLSGVSLSQIMHGTISRQNLHKCIDGLDKFKKLPFFIHDSSYLTIGSLRSLLRQAKRLHNIKLVVIDYLQLLDAGLKSDSREHEISKISRALKLIAKEINLPIIALSQLSRDIEKRNSCPKLSDLRGSGSIEQDADVIIFLYREKETERHLVNVSVAKNRNGALGEFKLFYHGETTTFKSMVQEEVI
jgi:replicative DNA helicase